MKHALIAMGVAVVLLLERIRRAERRRRVRAARPAPDQPLEEHLSPSGRFKAVVYAHDGSIMRVEVFRRIADEPTAPCWLRIHGPSFVDEGALPGVVHEALRAASGEVIP